MRTVFAMILALGSLGACSSDTPGLNNPPPGSGSGDDPIVCKGNPDGAIICKPQSEWWDCSKLPNADIKCVNQAPGTPGGGHDWDCKEENGKLVCTTPSEDVPGSGGWNCRATEFGTTCEKDAPAPPGGGSYTCKYDAESVWTCTGDKEPPTTPPTGPPAPPPTGGGQTICYGPAPDNNVQDKPISGVWAKMQTAKVLYGGVEALYVRFTLDKGYVDNTYGDYAVRYLGGPSQTEVGGGHSFGDLAESDKLEIFVNDGNGDLVQHFSVDYISADSSKPSGYGTLGVSGGEGSMIVGDAADILGAQTSLDYNFNALGHVLTKDSPKTDVNYTPDPAYPNWIFDLWYEVWIKWAAYGAGGPGKVYITGLHASPNKTGIRKFGLVPVPCP